MVENAAFLQQFYSDIKEAVASGNAQLALSVCRTMREHDLFIGIKTHPQSPMATVETDKPSTRCQRCGTLIEKGTKVYWKKNVGVWHRDCEELKYV